MIDKLEQKEYRVLARKYRPQTFKDLVGQKVLVNTLTNAIINNRIAHAYILTGVRGVGKTTTARLIAMSLNCEDRVFKTSEPCGKCKSCVSIRDDCNLDVIEMDAASKTGVDDIREIIDNIKYQLRSDWVSEIDYCEVRNEENLNISITNKSSILFVAFYLNKIRVIDNFILY